jgi:putative ABC transport system ATP-binding protein
MANTAPTADVLIDIRGARKSFYQGKREIPVLKDIHFQVARGEFVALEGRSGSGKSTLLSIMGLLDGFCHGDYFLLGHPVTKLSTYQQSQLRNRHIGWIFQNFNLIADMTVAENIMLPLRYLPGIARADYPTKVRDVLAQVELGDKFHSYPEQLSGGQQQRVAIARALVTAPSLLLADEPTGNLDTESTDIIFQLLRQQHQQGSTIVLVTHEPALAARCQRRVQLCDGRFVAPDTLLKRA